MSVERRFIDSSFSPASSGSYSEDATNPDSILKAEVSLFRIISAMRKNPELIEGVNIIFGPQDHPIVQDSAEARNLKTFRDTWVVDEWLAKSKLVEGMNQIRSSNRQPLLSARSMSEIIAFGHAKKIPNGPTH